MLISGSMDLSQLAQELNGSVLEAAELRSLLIEGFAGENTDFIPQEEWSSLVAIACARARTAEFDKSMQALNRRLG